MKRLLTIALFLYTLQADAQLSQVAFTFLQQDVLSADWSTNGRYIVTGTAVSAGPEITVQHFSNHVLTLTASEEVMHAVHAVRSRPGSTHFAMAGDLSIMPECAIYTLDPDNGTLGLTNFTSSTIPFRSLAWHPHLPYLAAGRTGGVHEIEVFDTSVTSMTSAATVTIVPDKPVGRHTLDWSPDGTNLVAGYMAAAGYGIDVFAFLPPYTSLVYITSTEPFVNVTAVDWSPHTNLIAMGLTQSIGTFPDALRIYSYTATNATNGTLSFEESITLFNPIHALHWSPDGKRIAAGTAGGLASMLYIYRYDPATATLTQETSAVVGKSINDVRWSPDGEYILVADDFNLLRIFTTNTADRQLFKTASPEPVGDSSNVTYTLLITNSGPSTAYNVVAIDDVPAEMQIDSVVSSQGSCTVTGQTVNCALGKMDAGDTATLTIDTTVITPMGNVTNRATLRVGANDPDSVNDTNVFVSTFADSDGDGQIDIVDLDDDNDGIPDAWERRYFDNSTNAVPGDDDDGDQVSNFGEYAADTVPTNNASFPRLDALSGTGVQTIRFPSSTARVYSVDYSAMLEGSPAWVNLASNLPGNGTTNTLIDAGASGIRVYRLRTGLPPP